MSAALCHIAFLALCILQKVRAGHVPLVGVHYATWSFVPVFQPKIVYPGQEETVVFQLKREVDNVALTWGELQQNQFHGRPLHVVMMHQHFTYFVHLHPSTFYALSPSDTFFRVTATFPAAGVYLSALDYGFDNDCVKTPSSAQAPGLQILGSELTSSPVRYDFRNHSTRNQTAFPETSPESYKEFVNISESERMAVVTQSGYAVHTSVLNAKSVYRTGDCMIFVFKIMQYPSMTPFTSLRPYLQAAAHGMFVSEKFFSSIDAHYMMHVHATSIDNPSNIDVAAECQLAAANKIRTTVAPPVFGPYLFIPLIMTEADHYHIFLQFYDGSHITVMKTGVQIEHNITVVNSSAESYRSTTYKGPCKLKPPSPSSSDSNTVMVAGVAGGVGAAVLIVGALIWLRTRRNSDGALKPSSSSASLAESQRLSISLGKM